jgi:hypothetical protein
MVTSKLKWVWIVVGPVLGLIVGTMLPHSPLHAVATDRQENFAIATGTMDGENEGIFFLDMLTGDLKGAVVNPFRQNIGYVYKTNVLSDLEVDASKSPKFLMVTGNLEVRPQGPNQYAQGVIYVAEVTSGKMVCYSMTFNKGVLTNSNTPTPGVMTPIFKVPLREAVVRSN